MSDHRIILDGLFPSGQELPPARTGRDEVRAAVDALLRLYDQDNARLTLALEQLDKAAAEIERLKTEVWHLQAVNGALRAALEAK